MNNEPMIKAVISYEKFKLLSDELRQSILNIDNEQVEFLISIKNEKYEKLSEKEKKMLEGFKRTEREPLRQEIIAMNMMFELLPREEIKITIIEQSFKEKHKKDSKPYVPKNLLNKNYNSKKKGGR